MHSSQLAACASGVCSGCIHNTKFPLHSETNGASRKFPSCHMIPRRVIQPGHGDLPADRVFASI